MPALIIFKFIVVFLEDFITALTEIVLHDAEEVELSFKATSAFILRVMQSSAPVKLDDVAKEIGVAVKEVFVSLFVEENVSSRTSQKCV